MANKKTLLFRNFSFSMSLMLFFIGLFMVVYFHNSVLSKLIKEQLSVLVELQEPVSEEAIVQLKTHVATNEEVLQGSIKYLDSKEALVEISEEFGQSMVFSGMENPFKSMIRFNVKAEHYTNENLESIKNDLLKQRGVEAVFFQNEVFDQINTNVFRISLFFLVIALIFLFVSIVILNNLIQLNMLTKKNEIRTMLLVGARVSFVRAPIINQARGEAIKSWVIASVALVMFVVVLAYYFELLSMIQLIYLIISIILMAIIALIVTMTSMYRILNRYFSEPYYDQKL